MVSVVRTNLFSSLSKTKYVNIMYMSFLYKYEVRFTCDKKRNFKFPCDYVIEDIDEKYKIKKARAIPGPRSCIKTRRNAPNAQGPKIPQTQKGTRLTTSGTQLGEISVLESSFLPRSIYRLRAAPGIILVIGNRKAKSKKIRGQDQAKNNPRGKEFLKEFLFLWEPALLCMRQ